MSADKKNELTSKEQQTIDKITDVDMPSTWKLSQDSKQAVRDAVAMQRTKHGLYASIPMLCKAEKCPYADVCPLVEMGKAPEGERCPLEIATILNKFEDYSREFQIDDTNVVDMNLVKDLIDCDVQIQRAENKMAVDGDFIEDMVVTVTESGEVITNPQLSKASEYKEKVMNKKHKILELMHSTRKSKAGDKLTVQLDPSTYAAQLMKDMQNMSNEDIIDGEYSELEETDE